jgi:hypothetical protein
MRHRLGDRLVPSSCCARAECGPPESAVWLTAGKTRRHWVMPSGGHGGESPPLPGSVCDRGFRVAVAPGRGAVRLSPLSGRR